MKSRFWMWLGLPAFFWLAIFVVAPFLIVLAVSFFSRGTYGGISWVFTWQNYLRIFNPIYLEIFYSSIFLSLVTTVICLVLSYPVAWALATTPQPLRNRLVLLLAIPFLTNLITRIYAIKLFTSMDGPLQKWLTWFGVGFDPFLISQNQTLVLYGMVTTYMPFMVFPIYVALEKFDFSLVEAAQDLGASSLSIFFKVILPGTQMAALSGIALVFVPCIGEFVIPDLLGGAKNMLAGNLITEQFLKARDWPFGASLAVTLVIILFAFPQFLKWLLVKRESSQNL